MSEGDSNQLNHLIENMNSYTRSKLFLVLADCEDEKINQYTKIAVPVLRINSALQDRQTDENQWKVILKEKQPAKVTVKDHPTIFFRSIFNSITVILIIVILLSHTAQGTNTDTNQVVYWKLMTKPAYFGGNIDLECMIKTEETAPMSWIRIPNGETIVSDKIPTDYKKFGMSVKYAATEMIYNLTIKQFNSSDVNRVYRCDFGFHSYAEKLLLNNRDFISRPTEKDMKYNFSLVERNLIGTVKIENGYPEPFCSGIFEGNNLSEAMMIDTTNSSIFFNTNIKVKYSTNICRGSVNVTCRYGDYELHIIQQVDVCSVQSKSNLYIVTVVIGTLSLVIIAVAVICVLKSRLKESCFTWYGGENTANPREVPQLEDDISLEDVAIL